MDTKNSPLALLAQTCSAIGADAPNPKLTASFEKSAKNLSKSENRDKSSPSSHSSLSNCSNESNQKSSFKPYESSLKDRISPADDPRPASSHTHRIRTPKSATNPSLTMATNGRCESSESAASQRDSPSRKSYQPLNLEKSSSPVSRSSTSKESSSTSNRPINESPLSASAKLAEANYPKTSTAPSVHTASPYFSAYGLPGLPYPMDLNAIMAHQAMFKAATMNPYLNYASRMKIPTTSAAESLMASGCRDPFCTGCALSSHPVGKCPPGCTQCESAMKSPYAHQISAAAAQTSAANAYAQAHFAALAAAATSMPHVCNWVGEDSAYCGKQFGTSTELIQHLRTHTFPSPDALMNQSKGMLPQLYQRTYPKPDLSPLSNGRYHPYSKAAAAAAAAAMQPTLPSSMASFQLPHPSISPYFNPYSLYGPRLGASSGMHP